LGLLAVFKYASFGIATLNRILPFELADPYLALPIGISFFTFKALSYSIDVYRGTVKPQESLTQVALYIAFFPNLMAGPIVRYGTIEKELSSRKFNIDDFASGVVRFIIGLGKKVVVADTIASAADIAFGSSPGNLSVMGAWLGAAAFALQVYFDFSGYSDMAIGLGRMFGFHFLENFNYPYISRSISEFWRRWHISLSTWFRDYVYFPLGGSRVKSKARLAFNLLVVWLLTGLWHGADWSFVLWGLMFFFLIAFEKVSGFGKFLDKYPLVANIYTLVFLLLGWVLFRAANVAHAFAYLQAMFGLGENPLIGWDAYRIVGDYVLVWAVGIIGCVPLFRLISERDFAKTRPFALLRWVCLGGVLLFSIALISGQEYNPFIYFDF
jgi:alginate O-acetyltransferase complex protein AlgI